MTSKAKKNDRTKLNLDVAQVKSVLMEQPDFLEPVVQAAVQSILEVEMEECLQAGKHERSDGRLITRVGTLVLRVPQDRAGQFSTQVFEQYQRSEKALVASLAQMYAQGVSTRKVAAVTEELYERRDVEEARRDLRQWLEKWSAKYPKLCAWAEANNEEMWTFCRLPVAHHKHLKSANLLERFNQEIKWRTLVARIFPNESSCLRLIRAVAAEQHEEWRKGSRYLNADLLREKIKPMKNLMMTA
jgi:transposase-like protein